MHRIFFAVLATALPVLSAPVAASPTEQAAPARGEWGAQIDYDHSIERPDQLAHVARKGEVARPAFATLQRSFGSGGFRPYLGLGVGQASARFEAVDRGVQDGLALKGVVGGKMVFTEEIGGFVQYDYAVAAENPALAREDASSHGIRLGLSIALN